MKLIVIFLLSIYFIHKTNSFKFIWINMLPKERYHKRGESLLIFCNATNITNQLSMFYELNRINYSIPRVTRYSSDSIYVGNLTLNENHSSVTVNCIDEIHKTLLSSKEYIFVESFDKIFPNKFPEMKCQDFSFATIECCVKQNKDEIIKKLGIKIYSNFNYKISIANSKNISRTKGDGMCYIGTEVLITNNLRVYLELKSPIEWRTYNFTFNRFDIVQPAPPILSSTIISSTRFSLNIKAKYMGTYISSTVCKSQHPLKIHKKIESEIQGFDVTINFQNFLPFSTVICTSNLNLINFSKHSFKSSSLSKITIILPEDVPNNGPIMSRGMTNYGKVTNSYIHNVSIYFGDLKEYDKNGEIINYLFKCEFCYFGSNRFQSSTNKVVIPGGKRLIKIEKVKRNTNVSITACTKMGCALNWTSLNVNINENPNDYQNSLIVSRDPGDFIILWWSTSKRSSQSIFLIQYFNYSSDNESIIVHDVFSDIVTYKTSIKYMKNLPYHPSTTAFALVDSNLKINWVKCFYQNTKPINLKYLEQDIIKINHQSEFLYGTIQIEGRRPSCNLFNQFFIYELKIIYNNEEKTMLLEDNQYTKVFFKGVFLRDIYSINVSIILLSGSKIYYKEYTGSFGRWRYAFLLLLLLFVVVIWVVIRVHKKISAHFTKNKSKRRQEYVKQEIKNQPIYNMDTCFNSLDLNLKTNETFETESNDEKSENTITSNLNDSEKYSYTFTNSYCSRPVVTKEKQENIIESDYFVPVRHKEVI